jgi:hypothetical protein
MWTSDHCEEICECPLIFGIFKVFFFLFSKESHCTILKCDFVDVGIIIPGLQGYVLTHYVRVDVL